MLQRSVDSFESGNDSSRDFTLDRKLQSIEFLGNFRVCEVEEIVEGFGSWEKGNFENFESLEMRYLLENDSIKGDDFLAT